MIRDFTYNTHRYFIYVIWMLITSVALDVDVSAKSEISKTVAYWKNKIQNNIHVFKDVLDIDENNLWCANSNPVAKDAKHQKLELDYCPTQPPEADYLPMCHKDEERDILEQPLSDIKDEDFDLSEIDEINESTYLKHEQNYKILLKEYTEVRELCKEAETSQMKKLCGDLDANMRKLLKLHENVQKLKRRVT